MEADVSLPSPSFPKMSPPHLIALSAAQRVGVVNGG